MLHPRPHKSEEGSSVMDVVIAIVITSIAAGGVYVFLGAHSGRLLANLKQDRDLLRFVSLTGDLEQRLALLYCDWWKQGIRYIEGEEGIELQAEAGDQIDILRIKIQERTIELSGPSKEITTTYHFETMAPAINPAIDEENRFTFIQLTYSESLRASLYLQSRPLYLPKGLR